jgi:hypothetical protein
MKLLMAMKEREAGIVSHRVYIASLVATEHDYILHDASCRHPGEIGQFERVTGWGEYRRWRCAFAGGSACLA